MDKATALLSSLDAQSLPLIAALAACAGLATMVGYWRRKALAAQHELENTRDLIENLSEGIYRSSLDGRQLSANDALVRLNGYTSEQEMLDAVTDIAVEWYVEPNRRDEFREILHRVGHVEDFVSEIYRHKTRERIWITESARIVRDKTTGRALYYEGSVREVTETVERLQLEELFRKLTSQLPGGLFQFVRHPDGTYTIPYASVGTYRLAGLPLDVPLTDPLPIRARIHPEDVAIYDNAMRTSRRTMCPLDAEFRVVRNGEPHWVRMMAKPEAIGETITWHGYVTDVSIRKRQEMEIEKLAFYDPLTGLPNRRLFMERMQSALKDCAHGRRLGALIFIDLDNFKALNDTKGHDIGDEYLVKISRTLLACVGERDTVARIGGDEFVVIIDNAGRNEALATAEGIRLCNRILAALNAPMELTTVRHQGSASLGLVLFDGRRDGADELLKHADLAMYEAKASGRNAVSIFDPAAMRRESERYNLALALREAIDRDDFRLHFQPQMDGDGRLRAAEALLRWYHPDHGIIKPDRFIPLAESSGLIKDLGRLVLAKGIRRLATWQGEAATAGLRLSLNISVQSFMMPDFVEELSRLIASERVDASLVTLEFTEHVMAEDHEMTAERMRQLKALGVRFSLDDFGTGYSSIAYLKQLPFDEVKIAGEFVADIATNDDDRALVRTILAMTATLGLETVAERVETEDQEAFLKLHGCPVFQGFRYSPPLSPEDFLEFARARNADVGDRRRLRA